MSRYFQIILLALICLNLVSCSRQPQELKTAERIMESTPDSALHILKRVHSDKLTGASNKALYALLMSQALDKNDIKVESDSLISIATDYFDDSNPVRAGYAWFYHSRTANNRGNAEEQANNLLKAQEYVGKTDNLKLKGLVYSEKGIMYKTQQQTDSSIYYFNLAYQTFSQIPDFESSILCLLNKGSNFLSVCKFDSALNNFHLAEKMVTKTNNTLLYSTIYRNLGSVYLKQKKYADALSNYYKVPLTKIDIYDSNKWLLIANVFIKKENRDSTRYYLNKISVLTEMSTNYYQLWLKVNEQEGKYKDALFYAKKIIDSSDSINKRKLEISFAGFEKRYKFQKLEITNQKLIIKNKHSELLLVLALLIIALIAVIVLFWRLHIKRKEAEYQKDIANKKHELLEKEKEKTAKEKENSVLLEKQIKFQAILLLNIEQYRNNSVKQPGLWKNKKNETKSERNKNFNEELIACMDMEYNNISKRLKVKFPDLSDNDIITCCLILAGFETGMIATIFDVKNESILIRRSRFRKKLKLEESENLNHFLREF
jgi:hypothetical protein